MILLDYSTLKLWPLINKNVTLPLFLTTISRDICLFEKRKVVKNRIRRFFIVPHQFVVTNCVCFTCVYIYRELNG